MTWLNPAAFVGLLALAIPILVHLFGRRTARRQRFPTLRLLMLTRATPATRSRPSDLLLLILRCGVVLAAVLGLAQPRWFEASRKREAAVPVRLILVDTSPSMRRLTSDGGIAVERARTLARQLLDSAREGVIVESASPGANVAGAASWLDSRSGLRELVIVSDFQAGAVSDGDLASLPDGIGLGLRRIAVTPGAGAALGDSGVVGVVAEGTMTRASWRSVPADTVPRFTLSIASSDSAAARSMLDAARAVVPASAAPSREVIVAFPGSSPRTAGSATFSSAWQGDLLLALRASRLLNDASLTARISACEAPGAVVARNGEGQVVASVMTADSVVVIHSCAEVGSVAGTALLAAAASALTPPSASHENEPNTVPDEVLRTWERPPTAFAPRGTEETSPDGRWFWFLAIALLLLEQLVRRGQKKAEFVAGGAKHERAA